LQDKGLTIKQIALEIRVSELTVKRDLAKMKSHIHRQKARLIRDSHEQTIVHFNSSSLKKQIKYIQGIRRVKARLIKTRRCKSLVITIDVNKAFGGRYKAVKVKPDLPVEMLDNGRITLD